jgi:hypothetical protein
MRKQAHTLMALTHDRRDFLTVIPREPRSSKLIDARWWHDCDIDR